MTLVWLDRAITSMMTLSGFVLDGMTRGVGWRFVSMGRRVERLATMCGTLKVAIDEGRAHELDWLLELADSSVTYRSRYLAAPEWLPVLDMVMRDEANPRSLAFQAKGLAEFIARLEATHGEFASAILAPAHAALRALAPDDLRPESEHLAEVIGDAAARRVRDLRRDVAEVLLACGPAQHAADGVMAGSDVTDPASAALATVPSFDCYSVEHDTRYSYRIPVSQSWQLAHLTPCRLPWQRVVCARARDRARARRAPRDARFVRQRRHPLRRARAASGAARSHALRGRGLGPARRDRAAGAGLGSACANRFSTSRPRTACVPSAWPSRARSCRGPTPRSPTRRRASLPAATGSTPSPT